MEDSIGVLVRNSRGLQLREMMCAAMLHADCKGKVRFAPLRADPCPFVSAGSFKWPFEHLYCKEIA